MEQLEFPAGSVIFHAGDASTSAYLIRSGTVELLSDSSGSAASLAQLGPGEVFGEMSLIEERPHALTARAASAVQLSSLTREEFELLLTTDPATFRIYLTALFERLRTLSAQVGAAKAAPSATSGLSVTIHPLTRRAAATLPREGLPVTKYPFRIGRAAADDEAIPLDVNDLWLIDKKPFNISRNHALLQREGDAVTVKDRGSWLGMYVNDVQIGGGTGARQMSLEDGDNILVLGNRMSPYQFRVHLARG
jgi:CRP/FNR family transcriptional regulator, cyclic AMP receptor protein